MAGTRKSKKTKERRPRKKTAHASRATTAATPAPEDKNDLATKYQPFVRAIVGQLVRTLGLPLDNTDEYLSAGYLGLVEAAERYDPSSGAEFRTYAFLRIRGAIIDAIRENTFLSGKAYRFIKALHAEQQLREASQQSNPPATRGAPSLAGIMDGLAQGALVFRLSGESADEVMAHVPARGANADQVIEDHQESNELREWVATLPEKERLIVEEYYFNGKSFVDISNTYEGMSKSWICRLHARALELLKERVLFQGLKPFARERVAQGLDT